MGSAYIAGVFADVGNRRNESLDESVIFHQAVGRM
jgi:hypothetical protein